jgi:SPP1 gp7 family putative phage head morphogenesis protein
VVNIVEGFKDRSRKNIDKWRKAVLFTQLKENPRFQDYHDLIDDLMTDGHLQSQINLRVSSTLNTDFHIINRKSGEENEELSHVLRQQWFFEALETYLMSIVRGFELIEFTSFEGDRIKTNIIPQRHLIPTQGKVIPDLSNPDAYIDFNDPALDPWVLRLNKPGNLGIMNNIVPALIWKRNVEQSWAEFCERFGIPLITATTNARDNKSIDEVHDMLIGVGEASVGTFPHGTEIKFHEANRTDAFNVYKEFILLNTDQVSKQLVGSTMLSDQGTNRSQTEVHERGLDDKIAASDKRSVMFMVNDQLLPLLKYHGYPVSDDDIFEFKTAEQEVELKELWSITSGLLTQGYPVEQNWISKTFNIPFEGDRNLPGNKPDAEKKKADVIQNLYPEAFMDRYPGSCCETSMPEAGGGKIGKTLVELTKLMASNLWKGKDNLGNIGKMIVAESLYLLEGLSQKFKASDSYTGPDLLMLQLMEYNLFEFSDSKTEARLASMSKLLIDYKKKALRNYADFEADALKITDNINNNWLRSEYNLSVAVGQNSASYVRAMKEKDTVTSFVEYQTIGDDLVRNSHRALDGKVFNLSDKEAMELWPPNGYGCRCEMLPILPEDIQEGKLVKGLYGKELLLEHDPKYRKSQFEINRGDLKQVFTKKQFYSDIKGLPEKLEKMDYSTYGIKSWKELKTGLKIMPLDGTIKDTNYKELFRPEKGKDFMGFEDYLGRKMTLDKKVFNFHTSEKYRKENEERHRLFPLIQNTLQNPDEVWYNDYKPKKFQSRYIKFYNDNYLVIDCQMKEDQGLEIKTWYKNKADEKSLRKGLKIK